jgi:hypothetical protein
MRNRRYVTRLGPLVVYGEDSGLVRAFRNIPGVDTQSVESLNLLQVRLFRLSFLVLHLPPLLMSLQLLY